MIRSMLEALRALAVAFVITAAFAASARAASLFYSAPAAITGATSVLGPSGVYTTLVDAKNLGGGATVVINGVQFAAATTQNTDAVNIFNGFFPGTTGNAGLDNLLGTGVQNNSNGGVGPTRLTLTGLTPNRDYRVQLIFVDGRPNFVRRLTVDGFAEVPIGDPHSLVGIFVADAMTQLITIARSPQATGGQSQLNGYALFGSAVPEPVSVALAIVAGALVAPLRRRRHCRPRR